MHVALTDVLTCPRCGPGHGLILLPDEVRDRRVVSGFLGCASCRERYPIRDAVAELGAGEPVAAGDAHGGDPERAIRLAALLGLADVKGVVVLLGPAAAHAAELADLAEGVEVVAAGTRALPGVTVIRAGRALPFQSGSVRGVALTGPDTGALLDEAARILAIAGRLLLDPAPRDARERLERAGLRLVAAEGETLLATR